jgi:hypothetical protein
VATQNLDRFAERLALHFSDIVNNTLAADPLTQAITAHDQHLIDHVDAHATKDYPKAHQMELDGYGQMLGWPTPWWVRSADGQAPAAGRRAQTGGTACRRR